MLKVYGKWIGLRTAAEEKDEFAVSVLILAFSLCAVIRVAREATSTRIKFNGELFVVGSVFLA